MADYNNDIKMSTLNFKINHNTEELAKILLLTCLLVTFILLHNC